MSKRFNIPGVPPLPFRIVGPKRVTPPDIPVTGPGGQPLEPAKPVRAPKEPQPPRNPNQK